ncbi:MAG: hypothetical protein U0636_02150 [Phycisphaerales bacterium]
MLRLGAANKVRWVVQIVVILICTVVFSCSLMAVTFAILIALSTLSGRSVVLPAFLSTASLVLSILNLAELLRPYRYQLRAAEAGRAGGRPPPYGSAKRERGRWMAAVNLFAALVGGAALLEAIGAPAGVICALIFVVIPLTCAAAHLWPPSYLQPHECQGCEYDLTQVLGDVCPECGRTRGA